MNENENVLESEVQEEIIDNMYTEKVDKKIIYSFIKRCVDIIAGLVGVLVLIPITLVLYIVNLFSKENKGPLFYEQLRIGKNGKYFRIYKCNTNRISKKII